MVKIITEKEKLVTELFDFILEPEVEKELGESVLFIAGRVFFVKKKGAKTLGFACVEFKKNHAFLRYFYTHPDYRKNGVFSELYDNVENYVIAKKFDLIKATSTNMALEAYKARGYQITKSWTNYFNIEKHLK